MAIVLGMMITLTVMVVSAVGHVRVTEVACRGFATVAVGDGDSTVVGRRVGRRIVVGLLVPRWALESILRIKPWMHMGAEIRTIMWLILVLVCGIVLGVISWEPMVRLREALSGVAFMAHRDREERVDRVNDRRENDDEGMIE